MIVHLQQPPDSPAQRPGLTHDDIALCKRQHAPKCVAATRLDGRVACAVHHYASTTDPTKTTCLVCLRLAVERWLAARCAVDGLLLEIERAWAREDDVATTTIERELRWLL